MKNAEKTDILTKVVSTVVFTNSVFVSFLCFFQFCIFAENTIKIGVSAPPPPKKKQKKKHNSKVKKVVQVKVKKCVLFVVFFGLFFKNPLLSAGRTRFSKTKKNKKLDHFLTIKRAKIGPLLTLLRPLILGKKKGKNLICNPVL